MADVLNEIYSSSEHNRQVMHDCPHLTAKEAAAVSVRFDPYSDHPIVASPEGTVGCNRAIVRLRKASATIDIPPSNGVTQTLAFTFSPQLEPTATSYTQWQNGGQLGTVSTYPTDAHAMVMGGFSWLIADDNSSAFWDGLASTKNVAGAPAAASDFTPGGPRAGALGPTSTYQGGAPGSLGLGAKHVAQRCLGYAFEVHNTTNALEIQGATTVWQTTGVSNKTYDLPIANSTIFNVDPIASTMYPPSDIVPIRAGHVDNVTIIDRPPANSSEAQQLPDSITMQAEQGLYMVPRPTSGRPPRDLCIGNQQTMYASLDGASFGDPFAGENALIDYQLGTSPNPVRQLYADGAFCGGFITGLSDVGTTFRVTCRWYIEDIPRIGDLDSVIIAQPNGVPNHHLKQLWPFLARRLPVAVPVSENDSGEWWDKVRSVLGSAITTLAPALGEFAPIAAGVGSLIKPTNMMVAPPMRSIARPTDQAVSMAGVKKLNRWMQSGVLSRNQRRIATQRLASGVIRPTSGQMTPGTGRDNNLTARQVVVAPKAVRSKRIARRK